MKKIGLICALLMLCGGLTACGSQSTKAKNSSSEISSLKKENSQLKHNHHKKQNKKKQSSSSSASSSINNSQNTQLTQQQQQGNNTTQSSQQNTQAPDNDPTQSGNIHDFVNQYGVSPALYKMQHYGMSQQQALDSTPDNMKTSGELQTQHQMEGN